MTIEEYLSKKKHFEFYILNINKNTANYEDIITVFKDSLTNPYLIENNQYTIVLSTDANNDVNQTVNALISDFGIKLKVFKSNFIDAKNSNYLNELKNLYFKYEKHFNQSFITIKDLALIILDKNPNDIKNIKPILLNKVLNDNKMYEIVNGMFINNLNVCKTADYVYMHRNTINNKIMVLKEETGLDIRLFKDAVILYEYIKR